MSIVGAWSPDGVADRVPLSATGIAVMNADGDRARPLPRQSFQRLDRLVARRLPGSTGSPRTTGEMRGHRCVPGSARRSSIPLDGNEAGVFSWQRTAP